MTKTKIPWCDYSWNPWTGCTPVSEGCMKCYAYAMAKRFNKGDFSLKIHPERFFEPSKLKKPSRIFVCSTSDFFHEEISHEMQGQMVFEMAANPRHTFMLLTKRPQNIPLDWGWPCNVWIGVTAENQKRYDERWPILAKVKCRVKFISVEPMLGEVDIIPWDGEYPDWVICGPENGASKRPCDPLWISHLAMLCGMKDIPFFDKSNDYLRDDYLRREWPKGARK